MPILIYHNPRCSKSRETLALLEQHGVQPQVELYLQQQFTVAQLQDLARKLQINSVREMMRTKDDLYRTLGLDNLNLSEQDLLAAIAQHSALLERPIVVNGKKAAIGRPPEKVLEIL